MRIDHRTELIENQIARFAPDFRDCVLARSVSPPAALEQWNPNLIGGDFLGGTMDFQQLLFRPTRHSTAHHSLIFISAEHPLPLVGVFMEWPGYHAARAALADWNR